MNKKLLVLIAFLIAVFNNSYAQDLQCQNLEIREVPSTCVIPYTELVADFLDIDYKDTDTYVITSEPTCPPELAQTTGVGIVADDDWSQVISLGFTFCYYGNMYDQIIVSDNGVVCFDLDEALQYHSWVIGTGITLPTPIWQQNSIFAPYIDTLTPADGNPTNAIRFDIINQDQSIPANVGNRRFIIEWDTPQFSCTSTYFKSRIVLYETSNVIDIMVSEKDVCANWQAGRAVIGIQNKSATRGMSPLNRGADGAAWDPRRTGGPGTAIDQPDGELWRFIPDGDQLDYNFAWFEDTGSGIWNYVSGDPTINVSPDVTTSYKAELTFQGECTYTPSTIFEIIQVDPLQNVTDIQVPDNLIACETVAGGGSADFDLDQEALLLADYPTTDWGNFNITYHTTLEDSNPITGGINPITTLNPYNATTGTTIYVRIEDTNDPACFLNRSFTLTVSSLDDSSFTYPEVQYCSADQNPTPTTTEPGGTYAVDNGGVVDNLTGDFNLSASGNGTDLSGLFTITYTSPDPCSTSSEFDIAIVSTNDANFTYPTSACIADVANPIATPVSIGGTFSVDNGATIDTTTGELDLSSTTAGTTYTITHEFTGNCPESENQTILIMPNDDATFSYPLTLYCDDAVNPMPTTATNGGIFSINNSGVIDTATGEIDLLNSGYGTFTVTYTTNGTCSSTENFDVTIEELKDATFDYPSVVCSYDDNPTATNITTTGGTFSVDNGGSIDSNGVLDLDSTTEGITYTITYSFSGNCPSSENQTVTVSETPTANSTTVLNSCDNGDGSANFDISNLSTVILGTQTNLTLTYHSSQDDANDGTDPMVTTPEVRASGDIYARVENTDGCFSTAVIPLIVDNCFIVIPEGFSPNSPNVDNQTFNITNINTMFPNYKIYIYNRLGNEVFSGDATKDDWNGKLNNEGDVLPTGTYFYGIKLNDEQDLSYRGWVYLMQ
ncbi:MAG: gliding motility-associated C-terminal domain-containing protein [Flavobacteriaceae bacterium]